ncbi:hypothetical protein [Corynebacterium gerontici]|uniref:Uncharacterized protein n=1 Tax=Corynebacterium gerontici TaxID=2079234 RepID=A0A3G6J287_9CORY|nr:hypothetical protein [Corynebacterium gerontici]AZA12016.1 hypothetical protein CGERO_08625 [Corynebacterium gerontici]
MLFFDNIPAGFEQFAQPWNDLVFDLMGRIDQIAVSFPEQWAQLLSMLPH